MAKKKSRVPGGGRNPSVTPSAPDSPLHLNLAERAIDQDFEKIEGRILHHSDRPEVELRILAFLSHTLGPSTEGIAAEMGIDVEAAAFHLELLREAGRVWGEPSLSQTAWHISLEGRHFLEGHWSQELEE